MGGALKGRLTGRPRGSSTGTVKGRPWATMARRPSLSPHLMEMRLLVMAWVAVGLPRSCSPCRSCPPCDHQLAMGYNCRF